MAESSEYRDDRNSRPNIAPVDEKLLAFTKDIQAIPFLRDLIFAQITGTEIKNGLVIATFVAPAMKHAEQGLSLWGVTLTQIIQSNMEINGNSAVVTYRHPPIDITYLRSGTNEPAPSYKESPITRSIYETLDTNLSPVDRTILASQQAKTLVATWYEAMSRFFGPADDATGIPESVVQIQGLPVYRPNTPSGDMSN